MQLCYKCEYKRVYNKFASGYLIEYLNNPLMTFELPSLDSKIETHDLLGRRDHRLENSHKTRLTCAWHRLAMLYFKQNMTFRQDKTVKINGLGTFSRGKGLEMTSPGYESPLCLATFSGRPIYLNMLGVKSYSCPCQYSDIDAGWSMEQTGVIFEPGENSSPTSVLCLIEA